MMLRSNDDEAIECARRRLEHKACERTILKYAAAIKRDFVVASRLEAPKFFSMKPFSFPGVRELVTMVPKRPERSSAEASTFRIVH